MHRSVSICFLLFTFLVEATESVAWWKELKLHPELLTWHLNSRKDLKKRCLSDNKCPYKDSLRKSTKCWGHESKCSFNDSYSFNLIHCSETSVRWPHVTTVEDRKRLFWTQGDFGYVKEHMKGYTDICSSNSEDGSFLTCSDHLRYCYAKNIFFNFKSLNAKLSKRYRDDVINAGEVGGKCTKALRSDVLRSRQEHKSYLQSWAAELEHFRSYDDFSMMKSHCDVTFTKPTIIIKLDASINMYHHFCDFVNIFASQYINGSFDLDVDILWWDTHPYGFHDALFGSTWSAFTKNKPVELISLDNKKVCFKEAMFSLLARMRLGLYYNMPVVDGCRNSGLLNAFCKHVLFRLGIKQRGPSLDKVRVTLLSRSTRFRRINNQQQLVDALRAQDDLEVQTVDYNADMPFLRQLDFTHNSDIFIGMHGSGLTHMLFLPDWAGAFEIYNCEDPNCYKDLAALRGVYYRTWERSEMVQEEFEGKHPTMGTRHAKFTNYAFDVNEFVRIVRQIAEQVRRHSLFVAERRRLRRQNSVRADDEL